MIRTAARLSVVLFVLFSPLSILLAADAQPAPPAATAPMPPAPPQAKEVAGGDVLTRENLLRIKTFILAKGDRQTYSQMYNNNPHFRFARVDCYLNPDTGQKNINCDPKLSDFNHLVIRQEFGGVVYYDVRPSDDKEPKLLIRKTHKETPPEAIRKEVEVIFRDLLAEIASAPVEPAWGEAVDGLQVSIAPTKVKFTAGESMPVTWRIRNVAKEDRKILWHELQLSPVSFEMGPKGGVKSLRGDGLRGFTDLLPTPPDVIVLRPGETKTAEFDLSRFLSGKPAPGVYEVTGVYAPRVNEMLKEFLAKPEFKDVLLSRIDSNTVEIEILAEKRGE